MKSDVNPLRRLLLPVAFALALLVILSGILQWSLVVNYALTALMFAALFGAPSARDSGRRDR